jgi:hypothetical protein
MSQGGKDLYVSATDFRSLSPNSNYVFNGSVWVPMLSATDGSLTLTVDTVTAGTAGSPSTDVLTVQGVTAMTPLRTVPDGTEYETVAASQTAQVLGPTGATGDYVSHILVIPATTSPGQVLLLDNATSITVFVGGASSVTSLIPFAIPLGMVSVSGAWKVTTGSNVSAIGVGQFT